MVGFVYRAFLFFGFVGWSAVESLVGWQKLTVRLYHSRTEGGSGGGGGILVCSVLNNCLLACLLACTYSREKATTRQVHFSLQ